ncbi:MAG: hypothetical protein FJ399_19655 [Verrucomicrobia bacterium]|nr:hypothetical protein [Verrucomicrobiota bacterium]
MSATPSRMPLARARALAEKIAAELTPFCDRLEIAGSIRRQRPTVGDIDLVMVPKAPHGYSGILMRCARHATPVKRGEQYVVFGLDGGHGFQLDLWFAHAGNTDLLDPDPPNFGVLLLSRTGSAAHNIWIAQQACALGLHFNPHRGVLRHGEVLASAEETEIFSALGLDFIPPEKRER